MNHTQSDEALESSQSPNHPPLPISYQGLTAYRVISWTLSRVLCWTGKDGQVDNKHRPLLEKHLLSLFEYQIDIDPEFLEHAQRQSIVFIHWAVTFQIA